ncbi:hypothetical protein [Aquihabitans sp. McL0605]|uniref:hypothetical protein n=1 Tax=Aquihabitans sp. McL0605 TaxID=3415671 RepID=UPI003CF4323C
MDDTVALGERASGTMPLVELITGLNPWKVKMADGSVLLLWASGYTDVGSERVFTVLMEATAEEQALLDVISRTPAGPPRVDVALARIPIAQIESTRGG